MTLMAIHNLDRDENFRIRLRVAAKIYGVSNSEAWVLANSFDISRDEDFVNAYLGDNEEDEVKKRNQYNITDEMIMTKVRELLLEQGVLTSDNEE